MISLSALCTILCCILLFFTQPSFAQSGSRAFGFCYTIYGVQNYNVSILNSLYGPWVVTYSGIFNTSSTTTLSGNLESYLINSASATRTVRTALQTVETTQLSLGPPIQLDATNRISAIAIQGGNANYLLTNGYFSGVTFQTTNFTELPNGFVRSSKYININQYFSSPVPDGLLSEHEGPTPQSSTMVMVNYTGGDLPSCDLPQSDFSSYPAPRLWSFCHIQMGYYEGPQEWMSISTGVITTTGDTFTRSPLGRTALSTPAYFAIGVHGVRRYFDSNNIEQRSSQIIGLGCTPNGQIGDCLLYPSFPYVTEKSTNPTNFASTGLTLVTSDYYYSPVTPYSGSSTDTFLIYYNSTSNLIREYPGITLSLSYTSFVLESYTGQTPRCQFRNETSSNISSSSSTGGGGAISSSSSIFSSSSSSTPPSSSSSDIITPSSSSSSDFLPPLESSSSSLQSSSSSSPIILLSSSISELFSSSTAMDSSSLTPIPSLSSSSSNTDPSSSTSPSPSSTSSYIDPSSSSSSSGTIYCPDGELLNDGVCIAADSSDSSASLLTILLSTILGGVGVLLILAFVVFVCIRKRHSPQQRNMENLSFLSHKPQPNLLRSGGIPSATRSSDIEMMHSYHKFPYDDQTDMKAARSLAQADTEHNRTHRAPINALDDMI